MLFDVDLGEDAIDIFEELEDALETPAGLTLDLQLADDNADFTDTMGSEMFFDAVLDDVISLDPDATAIAMSYQYSIDEVIVLTDSTFVSLETGASVQDTISVTDQVTVETSFNTDAITVFDQLLVAMTYGVAASDSVAVTDAVARGFDLIGVAQDTIALTDGLFTNLDYTLNLSDTLSLTDVIHTWAEPADGVLQVDFEGDGELNAVLVKRKPPPAVVSAAPPRVTLLPRPPKEFSTHNVVNPNPPNRGER